MSIVAVNDAGLACIAGVATEMRNLAGWRPPAVIKFCDCLPSLIGGRRIAQQLLDASTSVAANGAQ